MGTETKESSAGICLTLFFLLAALLSAVLRFFSFGREEVPRYLMSDATLRR